MSVLSELSVSSIWSDLNASSAWSDLSVLSDLSVRSDLSVYLAEPGLMAGRLADEIWVRL